MEKTLNEFDEIFNHVYELLVPHYGQPDIALVYQFVALIYGQLDD